MYVSVFLTNLAICNMCFVGRARVLRAWRTPRLRETVVYMTATRIVVLHSLSLLCWLRSENYFSFERRCSVTILFLVVIGP